MVRVSVLLGSFVALLLLLGLALPGASGVGADPRPRIGISVTDLTSGELIDNGQILSSATNFRVTVTSTGGDCAGQFVVSALGAEGAPPSVVVQYSPFIIGPAVGGYSFSGSQLNSGLQNDWKVSASCNGSDKNDFEFDSFEFFVHLP